MSSPSTKTLVPALFSVVLALMLAASPFPAAGDEAEDAHPAWLGFWFIYQSGEDSGEETCLLVQRVVPGGPAERAGLEKADRVVSIDSQPISRFSRRAVIDFMLALRIGQRVELGVVRTEEEPIELEVEAQKLPEELRKARKRLEQERKRPGP